MADDCLKHRHSCKQKILHLSFPFRAFDLSKNYCWFQFRCHYRKILFNEYRPPRPPLPFEDRPGGYLWNGDDSEGTVVNPARLRDERINSTIRTASENSNQRTQRGNEENNDDGATLRNRRQPNTATADTGRDGRNNGDWLWLSTYIRHHHLTSLFSWKAFNCLSIDFLTSIHLPILQT